MAVGDVLLSLFGIFIMQLVELNCYKKISSNAVKYKFKISHVFVFFIIAILFFINSTFNYELYKPFFQIFIFILLNYMIFKETFNILIFIKSIFIYLIISIADTVLFLIVMSSSVSNMPEFDKIYWLKTYVTIVESLIVYLFFIFKKINFKINKILTNKISIKFFYTLIMITLIFFTFISYSNVIQFKTQGYIINLMIVLCFVILAVFLIIQFSRRKVAEVREEVLLEFLTKYEKIIDKDRINRHEMLNNLLLIKSQKNKNSKKFDELLNDIINTYKNPETDLTKNIYNLPTGLKGILYYKIYEMKQLGINVNLLISNKIIAKINELDNESYKVIFKIVGILLDNAREGSVLSEAMQVFIEFYLEKDSIIIYIENTIKTNVNLKNISKKGFSTKGKNRGMGLYIVEKLLEKNRSISLVQETNKNLFVSKLKIMTK